jgi:hypothetical protein
MAWPDVHFFSTGEVASEGQRSSLEGTVIDDPEKERQIWFDYLGKINDRALQRQRASGFTNWAIVGVVILLGSQVLKGIPAVAKNPDSIPVHVVTLATIFDLFCFGLGAYKSIITFGSSSSEARLRSILDRSSDIPLTILGALVALLIGFLNLFSIRFAGRFQLDRYPFAIAGALMLIFVVGIAIYSFALLG